MLTPLSLDLQNRQDMEAFLQAIDHPKNRANLAGTNLSTEAQQLVAMVNDPLVQTTAVELGKRILKRRNDVLTGNAVPDDGFAQQVESDATALKQQLDAKFPQAMSLLAQYGSMNQRGLLQSPQAGWLAANAYVAANAAVYVNVAVATQLAIAAAAAAIVAVTVILV